MCVINIILHTLLLVDVCENINTIYIQLYIVKNCINIPQSFFLFYNQNSLFDMLEGSIIDCRVFFGADQSVHFSLTICLVPV